MASRGFSRIEELFHAALERAPGERAPFLLEACAGDADLLREVRSLLDHDGEAEDLLGSPAAGAAGSGSGVVLSTRTLRVLVTSGCKRSSTS